MTECYLCGGRIVEGEGARRRLKVGSSRSMIGTEWRFYYADQMVCRSCAFRHDARRTIVLGLLFLAGALAWLWLA